MKLDGKWTLRGACLCGWTLAGLVLAGCSSPSDEQIFSDMPKSPAMTGAAGRSASVQDVARFHVGDIVAVTLSGVPVEIPPHQEPIKEDGTITMPDIGKVQAAGKTAGELQNEILGLYVPRFYTHLTVTVNIGERVYYVSGEVRTPGRQLYLGETTVSKAIATTGDFTDFANKHKVWLIRANGQRIKVDVPKVLAGKAPDPLVYPGDQITVPRRFW